MVINEQELLKILKDGKENANGWAACLEETIDKAISFIEEEKEIRKPWTSDKTAKPSIYIVSQAYNPEDPIGIIFGEENAKAYCNRFTKPNNRNQVLDYSPIEILTPDTTESPWMDHYGTDEYEEE